MLILTRLSGRLSNVELEVKILHLLPIKFIIYNSMNLSWNVMTQNNNVEVI